MELLHELLGESEQVVAIRTGLQRLLPVLGPGRQVMPILLLGETGTGKGLLARLLHQASARRRGRFVAVNCAAIPEALLESELFGFERGAFTDARESKPGLVQEASGGTLFLDEIGLVPERLQAKLLTVLDDRMVRRLGGTRSEFVDVLIIAASNSDLATAVRANTFRHDLYHRLSGLTFTLPPLRDREGDIVALAETFLARACTTHGLPQKSLAADARAALGAYSWPGNVRELAHVIERAALLGEGLLVTVGQLRLPSVASADGRAGSPPLGARTLRAALESVERERVLEALRQTDGNVARAAQELGIPRSTLRHHLAKLRLTTRTRKSATSPPRTPTPPPSASGHSLGVRWEPRLVALVQVALPDGNGTGSPVALASTLETVSRKVVDFGGHIEEISTSRLLAVFGLEPMDDPALLAAHMGTALLAALAPASPDDRRIGALRVTLHAERLVIGRVNGVARIDLDAKCAAVALLESLAERAAPGTVVVSSAMAPLLRRRYRLDPVESAPSPAGPAYRIVGPERGSRTIPFVGRDREIRMLAGFVDRLRDHGQAIAIVGEAGIGKSRLLAEFREALLAREVRYLESRCAPFGRTVPYFAVRALLRDICGVTEGDDDQSVARKLDATAARLDLDIDDARSLLLPVLGVSEPSEDAVSTLAARQGRAFELLRQFVRAVALSSPTVIAVEDLHWIDRTSEQWMALLARTLRGAPLLLLVTHRSGYEPPPWMNRFGAARIELTPLGRADSLSIVHSAFGTQPLPEAVAHDILARAAGNPLFLEELTRDVRARGATRVGVPETLEHVLQARIDRVGEDSRRLLQNAAALGPEFPRALLAAVWNGDRFAPTRGAFEETLGELVRLDFLHEAVGGDEAVCAFRHPILQEVAYEGLSSEDRRSIHAAAGAALERLYAGRLRDVYDRLAHHYSRSGDPPSAVRYLTLFAEQAARGYARAEALGALQQALDHVERLAAGPEQDQLLGDLIRRQRGALHFLLDIRRPTLDFLLRQRPRVESLEDASSRSLYYLWLGRLANPLGEFAISLEAAERAIEEAERSGDKIVGAGARSVLSHAHFWRGRARAGLEAALQAVEILEGTGELYWLGYAWRGVSMNRMNTSDFIGAAEAARRVGAIGDALDDDLFRFTGAWVPAVLLLTTADAETVTTAVRRVLDGAPTAFETVQAAMCLGLVYLDTGRPHEAISWLEPLVVNPDRLRQRHVVGVCAAYLAEAHLEAGHLERAATVAADACRLGRETGYAHALGYALRVMARVAAVRRVAAEGEPHAAEADRIYEVMGSPFERARIAWARAELARARGEHDVSLRLFAEAIDGLRACGAPRYADRVEAIRDRGA